MSFQVIARKWRPQKFDDVIGQKIKEMLAFDQSVEPCLDHPEEGFQGQEVLYAIDSHRPSLLSRFLTRLAGDPYGLSPLTRQPYATLWSQSDQPRLGRFLR
jgi:hypothetical protein